MFRMRVWFLCYKNTPENRWLCIIAAEWFAIRLLVVVLVR